MLLLLQAAIGTGIFIAGGLFAILVLLLLIREIDANRMLTAEVRKGKIIRRFILIALIALLIGLVLLSFGSGSGPVIN